MANKDLIYKDNRIIEASYKLSLIEQRIVLMAISKVNATETLTSEKIFKITSSEYSSMFGMSTDAAMREMRLAVKKLYDASIKVIDDEDGSEVFRWISRRKSTEKEQSVSIRFTADIIPYLHKLKGNFTKYQIVNISMMSSIYAIRLYEMLMQWKSKQALVITVDRLRDRLMLDSDSYKAFANIKQKVIDKAITEINDFSDISASYELIKTGKKVSSIKFNFAFKDKSLESKISKEDALRNLSNIKSMLDKPKGKAD